MAQVELARFKKYVLQWNDIRPAEFILEDEKMFLVNRDAAVKKLYQHHSGASIRRTQAGLVDRIAILDDSFEMGKTAFGDNYIARCRSIEGSHFDKKTVYDGNRCKPSRHRKLVLLPTIR